MSYFVTKKAGSDELDLQHLEGLRRDSYELSPDRNPIIAKKLGKLAKVPYPGRDFLPRESYGKYDPATGKSEGGWSAEKKAEAQAKIDADYAVKAAAYEKLMERRRKAIAKIAKTELPDNERRFEYAWGAPSSTASRLSRRMRLLTAEDQRKFASLDRRIAKLQAERRQLIDEGFRRGRMPTPEELGALADKLDRQRKSKRAGVLRNADKEALDSKWAAPLNVAAVKAAADAAAVQAKAAKEAAKKKERAAAKRAMARERRTILARQAHNAGAADRVAAKRAARVSA